MDSLVVTGAREHNLKGVTVEVPKRRLVVFTGVSGSGKSSLAFDTLYAEGQRRFVESLSAYARQFLGRMERPRYDTIRGLSPTIAIEQRTSSANPRSTVATITEIADYLRVLFARTGQPHCPQCSRPVARQSAQSIVDQLMSLGNGCAITLLAAVAQSRKGDPKQMLDEVRRAGFTRVRIDGSIHRLEELPEVDPKKKHTVEVVVDKIVIKPGIEGRLADSVETALKAGSGTLIAAPDGQEERLMSEHSACVHCNISLPELTPQLFSWNAPQGMCPSCQGLGSRLEVDPDRIVPDHNKSLEQGAIALFGLGPLGFSKQLLDALVTQLGVDPKVPYAKLPLKQRRQLMDGAAGKEIKIKFGGKQFEGSFTRSWDGFKALIERKVKDTGSDSMRQVYLRFFSSSPCDACHGTRFNDVARAVRVGGRSLPEVLSAGVGDAATFFDQLDLEGSKKKIAAELLREVRSRLRFLVDVGLPYLTLDRPGPSLSGGEAQRIRLASQVGSELTGVLYVLDEPSIGLHARDTQRLLTTLERLRDLDNTVLVVEHDDETIRAADHVVDFGPGAGAAGGEVVATGTPDEIAAHPRSLTGAYLSGRERVASPRQRRAGRGELILEKPTLHNLKGDTVRFPLGVLVAITGVSGAGKSSLINGTLEPLLSERLMGSTHKPGPYAAVHGIDQLDKIVAIDQRPIGLTPRSNPSTYVKAFDEIRKTFASLPESKAFGFDPSRFSFNVKGGRCESCEGGGVAKVEMHFLPDVYVTCDTCGGKRFNEATLRVRFKGKSIADVLALTVSEAIDVFRNLPRTVRPLQLLADVGLGYVGLGQPSTTLSGGEAQRIKLARELSRRDTGKTFYVLDEPTTGLHFDDVRKLLVVLDRLVEAGNTVLVIEHNLDVVKTADHVIDLGPEGGDRGGKVVATGTPEEVAEVNESHTGRYLRALFKREAESGRA